MEALDHVEVLVLEQDSPSCSRVKLRQVVSSFRFLLKSMLKLLSFFLMLLISWKEKKNDGGGC